MRLVCLSAGAITLASLLAGSGCSTKAPSGEDTASTSQAIQNGAVDETHKFAVGVCNGTGAVTSGSCFGICSGALILPNVVATARHCVDESPQQVDCTKNPSFGGRKGGSFRITTNTTMAGAAGTEGSASGWYGVSDVYVPEDAHICGNDIALLVLRVSVPANVTKPITPGVQYLMWDPDQYAPSFFGIGYGNTSPAGQGSGTRRKNINAIPVLCVPGSDDMPCPPEVNPSEFFAGDGTCSGDSGSSAFERKLLDANTPVSFGVLSRGGQSDDGTRCMRSIYTRFDAHRDFVLAAAKAASNNWTAYPEPSWTTPKPPPKPKPKDAGAPPDSGAPTKGLDFGEACETAADCKSKLCSDTGDGTLICSSACDETTSCPDGYECRESVCLPPAAAPSTPAAGGGTTTGCAAVSSSGSSSTWAVTALGTILALAAVRRRKR
ncbi:MAG: hypothetical protein K0S65_1362 [Labilithrix sp.]|nr:hypothetical protein [Labilithrix sp.]